MHQGASVEEVMPSQSSALNRKCSVFAEDSTLFRYFVFTGQFVCGGAIEDNLMKVFFFHSGLAYVTTGIN